MKRVIFLSIPDNRIYEEKKWKQFTSAKLPVIHPCGKETGAVAAQWLSRLCSMRGWYVYLYRPKREEKDDYRVKMMNAIRSEMNNHETLIWMVECRTFVPVSVYDERSELQLHDHDSHSMYVYPSTKETMGMELANRLRNETTEKYSVSIEQETIGKTNYKWIHKMGMGHCFTMDFHLDLFANDKRFFSLCNAISEWIHLASLRFESTNTHHKTTQLNKRHQTHVSASSSSSSSASYHLFVSSSKGDPFQPPPPSIVTNSKRKNKEVSFDMKQKRENTSDGPYERIILNLSASSKNFLPHSYVSAQAIGESVRWDRTSQLVPVQTYPVEFWTTVEKVNKDTTIRLILSEKKMDTLKTRMVYSEYAHAIIPLSLFYQKAMVEVSMNWVYGVSEEKEKQKIKFQMSLHPDCTLTRRISDRLTVVPTEKKKKREEKEKKIIIEKYQQELHHQIETHLTQQSIYSEFPSGRRPTWNRLLHVNQTSFGWMNDFMYFWIQEKSSLPLSVVDTFADHLIRVTCLHLNLTLNEYFTWSYTQEGFVPFFFSQLITLIPGLLSYTSDEFEDNHSFPWSAETKKTSDSATDCEEIGSTCTFVIKQLMKAKKSSLMAPMRDFLSHYIPFTCHITAQQDTEKGASSTKTDILHVIAGMMPRSLYQTLLIKDLPTKAPKESDLELVIESDPLKFPVLLFDAIADAEATYYHYEPPQKRNRAHLETPEEEMRLPSITRRFYDSRYQMAHKLKYNLLAMYVMDENDIDKCKELIPVIWNYHTESWCWGMPLSLLWCGFRTGVQGIPKPPTPVKFSLLKYTALWEAVTPSNELKQLANEISNDVSIVNRIRFTPDKASSYLTDHSLDETVLLERKTYPNRIRSIYLVYRETDTGTSLKKRLERDLKQSNLSLLYKTHIISTSSVYIIDGFDDVSRVLLLYNVDKK